MNFSLFTRQSKRFLQAILLLAILLISFSSGNTHVVHAAPPSNDDFASATVISSIPYTITLNTTEAVNVGDGPQVNIPCDGNLLAKGSKNVWYRYTPSASGPVYLDTLGTTPLNYDTYIAVWTGPDINNLTIKACDDDDFTSRQSQLEFSAVAGTTYHIEIAQFNGYQGGTPETPIGGNLHFHLSDSATASNVMVQIAGNTEGQYFVEYQGEVRPSYIGVDSGPVKVQSTNGVPIVSALRDAWMDSGAITSSIQLMGLPENQLSDTYLFPAYNNVSLDDQLRFGNVGNAPTTVTVTIGGQFMGSYPLNPSQSVRVNYPALDSGPVKVQSSGGVKIIASIRDSWHDGTKWSSYAQIMGMPQNLLSTTYLFPAYNNVSLDDQLRFGNVGNAPTDVTVTIGGNVMNTYHLNPNQSIRVNYPGVDSGPVKVQSSGGVPIIVSLRDAWHDGTKWTSYFQLMGVPSTQLSDTYFFPSYDNVTLDGQLRFGNVGSAPTTVTVKIGGVLLGSYPLNPNQSKRVNFSGVNNGPVVVQSSGGVKIIASLRDSWFDGTSWTSYSQMMGLPASQLSTVYLFPAYNNVTYDNQLRIGVP